MARLRDLHATKIFLASQRRRRGSPPSKQRRPKLRAGRRPERRCCCPARPDLASTVGLPGRRTGGCARTRACTHSHRPRPARRPPVQLHESRTQCVQLGGRSCRRACTPGRQQDRIREVAAAHRARPGVGDLRARRGHGPASSEIRRELRADDMRAAVHVSPRRRHHTLPAAARRAGSFPPRHLAGRSTPTPSRGPLPRNSAVSVLPPRSTVLPGRRPGVSAPRRITQVIELPFDAFPSVPTFLTQKFM